MSQHSPNLNIMIQAAEKAARSLTRDFGEVEKLQISRKGPGDFVSRADTRAEEIIHEHLETSRPGYGFLMEESGEIKSDRDFRWIIDPLDGTFNFLHGVPHWAISIALEKGGEVIAGVVYNPITDELFRAEKGRGAFLNRQRLRVSGRTDLDSSVIGTGYIPDIFTTFKVEKGALPFHFRHMGSCALGMSYVGAGRFDGYYGHLEKAWDFAAGAIIVQEAGGAVSGLNLEKNYLETNSGIVCGNPDIYRKAVDLFGLKKSSSKKSA